MKKFLAIAAGLLLMSCEAGTVQTGAAGKMDSIKNNDIALREFLQAMPKGGDLHNHLFGAVYAESWLKWAEEDGMCIDKSALAIRFPNFDGTGCGDLPTAKDALAGDQVLRNELIDKFSLRDYVPSNGWSAHDQFFATFGVMGAMPSRFGDMVAETSNLAGRAECGPILNSCTRWNYLKLFCR